ncbi:MAG: ribbon-helix-helix domain-containing protein [Chloroflexi bacterium]|nr:ribbon-helix-helix domain-containing protein [Chloroflexota bacterium]
MVKRTTVSASEDDLATLEREAARRGVPLARMLREAVVEYAAGIRAANSPRFGVASGDPGLSEASAEDETAPITERSSGQS